MDGTSSPKTAPAAPVQFVRDLTTIPARALRRRSMANLLRMGHSAPTVMQTLLDVSETEAEWLVRLTAGLPGGIGNTGAECGGVTAIGAHRSAAWSRRNARRTPSSDRTQPSACAAHDRHDGSWRRRLCQRPEQGQPGDEPRPRAGEVVQRRRWEHLMPRHHRV